MLEINNHIIMTDTIDILTELKSQLAINGIQRFNKFIITQNNIQTNCPFHKDGQERKPSFGIGIGKNNSGSCHCFGCGWTGSIQEMISNCFGYDDFGLYGSKWLIKNFLTVEVENREMVDIDCERNRGKLSKTVQDTNKDNTFIRYSDYDKYRVYHEYMWKRKLTPEVVDIFDIGYDDEKQCILFPIKDMNGNILYCAERSVNTKFFHYPEGVDKPLYGLYELYMNTCETETISTLISGTSVYIINTDNFPKEIYICESMLDALYLWTQGKYAIALNGLGSENQFKELRRMPNRKFIIATDSDEAGMKTRQLLKKELSNKIVTQVILPKGRKDINDCTEEEIKNLKEIFI